MTKPRQATPEDVARLVRARRDVERIPEDERQSPNGGTSAPGENPPVDLPAEP